jgi:hypothetical protein
MIAKQKIPINVPWQHSYYPDRTQAKGKRTKKWFLWAVSTSIIGTVLEGLGVTPEMIAPLGTRRFNTGSYDVQIQADIDTLLEQIGQ